MELNGSTFLLFAAQHYDNPHCEGIEEFHDDLKRIKYIKRLFKKYYNDGELRERLILNHLVILYNVFEAEALTKMLRYKLDEYESYLKPFLFYLNYWNTNDTISMDLKIIDALRKI
tara:strand:+ start:8233 stop:8580 length:348 start_codon:yes stop_codon:yes gene_type:complete